MAVNRKPPYLVELVGPAGAGKTSLIQALTTRSEMFLIGSDLQLRKIEHLPIFLSYVPFLMQDILGQGQPSRRFTWDEIKSIVYLKGGPKILDQQAENSAKTILLDHGPVFKLATLNEFGPDRLKNEDYESWWQSMFKQWASILDLIIWLDASDKVLKERINSRSQNHAIKGKSEQEGSIFLGRYRSSFEQILENFKVYGGPTLLQFDASQSTFDQIVDEVLINCNFEPGVR